MKTITYAISPNGGLVYSRVDSEVAIPVYQFDEFGKDGDFSGPIPMKLERFPVFSLDGAEWNGLKWTRKIPVEIKNRHRKFWGMKPLAAANPK